MDQREKMKAVLVLLKDIRDNISNANPEHHLIHQAVIRVDEALRVRADPPPQQQPKSP